MTAMARLILASSSPRRRLLLSQAGYPHEVIPPDLDDARLRPGDVPPDFWPAALAYLKASRVLRERLPAHDRRDGASVVVGADTIVLKNNEIIGQPADAAHAEHILRALSGGVHRVVTGVAVLVPGRPRRLLFDQAIVRVGNLDDDRIAAYVASGQWRGKAGAYNLSERLADGWPITFEGDPACIMGLPMRLLKPLLDNLMHREAVSAAGVMS